MLRLVRQKSLKVLKNKTSVKCKPVSPRRVRYSPHADDRMFTGSVSAHDNAVAKLSAESRVDT